MSDFERLIAFGIRNISHLDELCDTLDMLAREIERIFDTYRLDAEQLQEMAQELAHLRHRISTLSVDGEHGGALMTIAARYRELEGRAKELRNDHRMQSGRLR